MRIICPACKKENTGPPLCSRCGCDFTPLAEILTLSETILTRGIAALKLKNSKTALACAENSWALKNSCQAAQLGFLASLMKNDSIERTLRWYTRVKLNSENRSVSNEE